MIAKCDSRVIRQRRRMNLCLESKDAPLAPTLAEVLDIAPWQGLEEHLTDLRGRVDESIAGSQNLRRRYREELLAEQPDLPKQIRRPSEDALANARELILHGSVAAADGTVSQVPLAGGAKLQVGVVIVFNSGEVVDLVTRVFEHEMTANVNSTTEYFAQLRGKRRISSLVSHAIMLFGERSLLIKQPADWRLLHGELIPHEKCGLEPGPVTIFPEPLI